MSYITDKFVSVIKRWLAPYNLKIFSKMAGKIGKNGMLVGGIALAVAVAGGILLAGFIQNRMMNNSDTES